MPEGIYFDSGVIATRRRVIEFELTLWTVPETDNSILY